MAKITFKNNSVQFTPSENLDSVNITRQDQLRVNQPTTDNLDTVKILRDDLLRVVYGVPTKGPIYVTGQQGPTGPTGPAGGLQYFYSDIAPADAVTGDKWFHPPSGIEFTRVQGQWVQLL